MTDALSARITPSLCCALALTLGGCSTPGPSDSSDDAAVADAGAPAVDVPAAADLGAVTSDAVTAASAPVISATLRANPDNVVSAIATLHVEGAASVTVSSGDDATEQLRTTTFTPSAADFTVPVLGLTPGAANHVVVTATAADGRTVAAPRLLLTTGALPSDFPPITVGNTGYTGSDHLLVSIMRLGSSFSVAAILDRAGRYEWYRRGGVPGTLGLDFKRGDNGHYFVYQSGASGFVEELDLTSTLLHSWAAPGTTPFGIDGHEFVPLANDHALALVPGLHTVDTRGVYATGVEAEPVMDFTVQELDGAGGASTRWSSWPAIGLDETTSDLFSPVADPLDALHPNALSVLPDGDYLISLRHADTVLKVDPTTGAIVWRLGGARSNFTFVNDPLGGFSHQHFARQLPNGHLLMVDNGNLHDPPVSRVVEYQLDETAHTATMVWQYLPFPDLYSLAAGSAERLANGNTLVSWGILGQIVEVDPSGAAQWSMNVAGCMVYRALPIDSL